MPQQVSQTRHGLRIALAGPFDTSAFMAGTGVQLRGFPPGTGNGSPVTNLAAEFHRRGLDIVIVTLDGSIEETLKAERERLTIFYCPFRGPPKYRARVRASDFFRQEINALERALLEASPDFVHAHWTYEYAEAAIRSGLPHLVTMHDRPLSVLAMHRDAYRLMRFIMALRTMPRIRRLAVVSPFMRSAARWHGYFGGIDLLFNGIEIPRALRDADSIFMSSPLKIATVGDPTRLKNIAAALDAYEIIRTKVPGVELHLFGPGLDAAFTKGAPGVVAHGQIPHADLMAFLAREAVLLLHPSLQEALPMAVLEAKARGVPVIGGSNAAGMAFACGENSGARLIDTRDPGAICEAAVALLTNPDTYRQAAAAARADAQARFALPATANQHLAAYEVAHGAQTRKGKG